MEDLIKKNKPKEHEFFLDKKFLSTIKTLPKNKTVEQINKKNLTLLCKFSKKKLKIFRLHETD
jgi:hypothetical protein